MEDKRIKNCIKTMFAIAFNLIDAAEWFKNITIILTSEFKNDSLDAALSKLNLTESTEKQGISEAFDYNDDLLKKKGLRTYSPFYKFFLNIYEQNKMTLNGRGERNDLFCPSLLESVFERKVRSHVMKIHTEIDLGISKHNLARVPKIINSVSSDDSDDSIANAEEKWNRKPRAKFTFFSGKYLKYLPKYKSVEATSKSVEATSFSGENKIILDRLENNFVNDTVYYKTFGNIAYYIGYYEFVGG
ncbi:hypothetical protein JTB14_034606 [Gonioctena quinquepunctata]|nr:hypothetical protein JTB14_034606 [Gonioctena quinquepunctata]